MTQEQTCFLPSHSDRCIGLKAHLLDVGYESGPDPPGLG